MPIHACLRFSSFAAALDCPFRITYQVTTDGNFAIVFSGGSIDKPTGGVALSKDGKEWNNIEMQPANISVYPPRYGAYPTASTWYLTAGNFPAAPAGKEGEDGGLNLHHINYRVHGIVYPISLNTNSCAHTHTHTLSLSLSQFSFHS
jgi:hypothetical protein